MSAISPLAVMKGVLAVAAATYGIAKAQTRKTPVPADKPKPTIVEGTVEKEMHDASLTYLRIAGPKAPLWVGMPRDAEMQPQIGATVRFEVTGVIDAYESRELAFAFERMHFADFAQATTADS